jgi:hypothetical protein
VGERNTWPQWEPPLYRPHWRPLLCQVYLFDWRQITGFRETFVTENDIGKGRFFFLYTQECIEIYILFYANYFLLK